MNNNLLDSFIDDLEETYGKYRQGMQNAIRNKLSSVTKEGYDNLYRHLIENYDMARPPSLKVILGEMYKYKIPLNIQQQYGISICEHCGYEYSQDIVQCPKCQKIRIYGVVKLIRYRPSWYDFGDEIEEDYTGEIQSITEMFEAKISMKRSMTDEEKREYIAEQEGKRIYEGEQDESTAVFQAHKDLDSLQDRE